MNIIHIYALPLIDIPAIMLLAIALWTTLGIVFTKKQALCTAWRAINMILSGIAVVIILRYTMFTREGLNGEAVPFIRTIEQIREQRELIREMVMNAFLFFPFGLVFPCAKGETTGKKRSGRRFSSALFTVVVAFMLTCAIEFFQFLFKLGNAELSDIVMNTLGACVGTLSYVIYRKILLICQKKEDGTRDK